MVRVSRTAGLGVLMLVGCQSSDPGTSVVVDTSANGAVTVTNVGPGRWGTGDGWALTRVAMLGSNPSDTVAQFAQIWDFTVDELGRIYVLDREDESISVFTVEGRLVRSIGRAGQGPGELRGPTGLAWDPEGRLWVANVGNARFEVFDTTGADVASFPRRALGYGYPWGGVFLKSGALSEPTIILDPVTGTSRPAVLLQPEPDVSDAPMDTVLLPEFERRLWRVEHDRGRLVAGVPFAAELRWQMDADGELWLSVNDDYRLYRANSAGDTTRAFSRVVDPVPVHPDEIDAQLELFERTIPEFRTRVDLDLIPDYKPAFDVFLVDGSGYLWVAQSRAGESYPGGFENTFDIFDIEGVFLGSLEAEISTVPPPKVFGDLLIGVSRDEFETQRVVVYRIDGRDLAG